MVSGKNSEIRRSLLTPGVSQAPTKTPLAFDETPTVIKRLINSKRNHVEPNKNLKTIKNYGTHYKEEKSPEVPCFVSSTAATDFKTESPKDGSKVTFNPMEEDIKTKRRFSVPEEAISFVPKSILKKRSSICLGGLTGQVNRKVDFAPGASAFCESAEAFALGKCSCEQDRIRAPRKSQERKAEITGSDEFTRILLEMKNEKVCDSLKNTNDS
nr:PREDICTED: uncharacterized protein LOC107077364 [Lepisosteus oculatus]